jgi:Phospholipase/Carboxylesterase
VELLCPHGLSDFPPLLLPVVRISIFSRFDCYSFDIPNRTEDKEGLFRAVNWVNKLISIEETEHNIPPNRIIIGGLSQGGAVSLLTTITIKKPLAGLFALSTYIPLRRKTPEVKILAIFLLNHIKNTSKDTHPIRETDTHLLGSWKAGPTGQSRIFHQVR